MVGERGKQVRDQDQVFGALQDLTDSRRAEALADYLALHDELTGLNNRRLFIRQIGDAITEIQHGDDDQHSMLFVAFIDLMRFHRHNDALGQSTGDLLLRRFAGRLGKLVPNPGAVARVGGDEFGILLRCTAQDNALDRFNALLANLSQPFYLDGNTDAFLTYTVGIARYPDDGADADELLAMAQEAQRLARNQGRGLAFATSDQQSGSRSSEALALERDLHRALDNEEFFLVYQPQMDLRQGQIVGVEALLRWHHPERGLVSPIQFIPVLEDTGLITRVGDWVIAEACRQSAQWSAQGLILRVGINLSPRQFLEPTLFDRVMLLIAETGANPNEIELEITESLAMQEPATAIALLQRFRAADIQIAIDDFGIGHSSLEYLLKFPIDAIKIDRAFVINVTNALADRAIVRAVTAIGQTLGLNIIAEGVETLRQCDFLEALGVTEIQGYLIGKPMPPRDLIMLLQTFSRPGF
nr:bifunctional diguanylate cyclase/phosphodiesterase [Thiospirillum jenense]